jgi:hypothetical protein
VALLCRSGLCNRRSRRSPLLERLMVRLGSWYWRDGIGLETTYGFRGRLRSRLGGGDSMGFPPYVSQANMECTS